MLIVIEGGDAVGKQTQTTMLAEKLNAARFAFPNYESPTGKLILQHLKKQWRAEAFVGADVPSQNYLNDLIFQSLQTANRLESLPSIQAAIAAGSHVVFDRYWQSACVYGALDGLDEAWLHLVQERPMLPADVSILIDVPVEEGFKRRPERRDRYETNRPFLERVREKYLELWWGTGAQMPEWESDELWTKARDGWFIVNGTNNVEDVHLSIVEIVALFGNPIANPGDVCTCKHQRHQHYGLRGKCLVCGTCEGFAS